MSRNSLLFYDNKENMETEYDDEKANEVVVANFRRRKNEVGGETRGICQNSSRHLHMETART